MSTRLSLIDIQKTLVDFVECGNSCCGDNCIASLLEGSDEVARLGGGHNRFPKAVLAARMAVYVKNQNKAADNLRNVLAMCRNPRTNRTEYRFFHKGELGDVKDGVPQGFPVREALQRLYFFITFSLITLQSGLITPQSTGVF
jgi:hypothetical protein